LAEHFDEAADQLIEGMRYVADRCLSCERPIVYLIGDTAAYDIWKQAIKTFPFADAVPVSATTLPDPAKRHIGMSITGEVNYCAEVFRLSDAGVTYSPRMDVVTGDLCSRYLWDEVRAKGGAYGAGTRATRYGLLVFSSYRDPRVKDTYEAYHKAADWILNNLPDEDELDGLIVSSLAGYYAPTGPFDQGIRALNRYLMGMTADSKLAEIDEILGTTTDDFRAYAYMLQTLVDSGKGIRVTLGSRTSMEASDLFDQISEL
jgi:Zn-dependent M16 (insulinase) family peptidase